MTPSTSDGDDAVTTITASVMDLPDKLSCGICEGEPLGDPGMPIVCPQCGGSGVMPFPPMPECAECDSGSMVLIGHGTAHERDETLPVYRCANGHLTAIRYVALEDE